MKRAVASLVLACAVGCAAPLVPVSQDPADGAAEVPVDVNPAVTLSEPVRLSTVPGAYALADEAGAPVAGAVFAQGAATLVFVPEAPLAPSTTYVARLGTALAGLEGGALAAPVAWRFTTAATGPRGAGAAPLAIVAVGPRPGATGVETGARPWVRFDRELQAAGAGRLVLTEASGERVPASESVSADGRGLELVPARALAAGRSYVLEATRATVAADGARLAASRRWSFTTTDDPSAGLPFTVVSSSLADGAVRVPVSPRIVLRFSHPVEPASVDASSVRLAEPGAEPVALNKDIFESELSIAPREPLATSRTHVLEVTGVRAADGRVMEPASFSLRFYTSADPLDGVPPRVASVSPPNGASAVPADARVVVTFTRPMELASFAVARPTLTANGAYLPVTRDLAPDGRLLTIVPVAPLPLDVEVVVTIPEGLRDAEDKLPCPGLTTSFYTGVDREAPRVVATTPADGAQGVDPAGAVAFALSEPVVAGALVVRLVGPAGEVGGAASLDGSGRVATFTPASPLAMQTSYTATLEAARDLAGNALAAPTSATFRTSGTPDVTPPAFGGLARATALDETRLRLEWAPATDDRPFSPVYRVYSAVGQGVDLAGPFTTVRGGSAHVLEGLRPGTTYALAVRAVDAAGNVDGNAVVLTARTPDLTPPSEVPSLSVAAVPGAARLSVSWGAATDEAAPAATLRYRLYVGTSAGGQTFTASGRAYETAAGATSADLEGPLPGAPFLPGRRYHVVVRAVDADGNECPSRGPEASAALPDTTPPLFDGPVTATAVSATSIRVTWTQASDDGDTAAELTYRVSKRRADAAVFDPPESAFGASLARTVTGLTADVAYVFRVEAQDRSGNVATNPNQPSAIGLDLAAPAFPLGSPALAASPGGPGAIEVSWRAASDNRTSSAAMTYIVFASTVAAGLYAAPVAAVQGVRSARLEGLSPGSWTVAVRARDEAGNVDANAQAVSVAVGP